jgi:hypothetical protein
MPDWTAADSTEESKHVPETATHTMNVINFLFFLSFLRSAIQTTQQALMQAYDDPGIFAAHLFTEDVPINKTVSSIHYQCYFVHEAAADYAKLLIEEVKR